MGNKIFALLFLLALCFGGYYFYHQHKQQVALESGEVQCIGCDSPEQHARFLKENSGETADGQTEHKKESAQQAAATAAAGDASAGTPGYNSANRDTPGAKGSFAINDSNTSAPSQPPAMTSTPASMPPPASDSQAPNSVNNVRFAGSGSYQWYRQGNLTYRIDTSSGRSCVAYATLQEWRKQIVLSHGCGREG